MGDILWLITDFLSWFLPRHPFLFVHFLCDARQRPHHPATAGTRSLQVLPYETRLTVRRVQIEFVSAGPWFACSISFLSKPQSDCSFSSHRFEAVIHSILACRLMIGIREASQSSEHKSETFELSVVFRDDTIEFARRSSEGESV